MRKRVAVKLIGMKESKEPTGEGHADKIVRFGFKI